jgi:hypothetical protein
MDTGQWLTRSFIWLALCCYVASEAVIAVARNQRSQAYARWFSTLGCFAFLAHVGFAFHFYHEWSHARAYAETARQTAEVAGWRWGGGLFINYGFGLLWLAEVVAWWCDRKRYSSRAAAMNWSVRAIFLFMIFNGAVVFVRGPVRGFGLVLCLVLAWTWWCSHKQIGAGRGPSKAT